jgi:hypothetical protein
MITKQIKIFSCIIFILLFVVGIAFSDDTLVTRYTPRVSIVPDTYERDEMHWTWREYIDNAHKIIQMQNR